MQKKKLSIVQYKGEMSGIRYQCRYHFQSRVDLLAQRLLEYFRTLFIMDNEKFQQEYGDEADEGGLSGV
jgi:hypothetical protein